MRPRLRVFVTAGLATALFWFDGCVARQRQPLTHTPTALASTTQMGSRLLVIDTGPAARYHYIMPEEQQRRIVREAPLLCMGDSVDDVVRRLGPPMRDDILRPKETEDPIGRVLTYYFARRDLRLDNDYDPRIGLFFMDGRLEHMYSTTPSVPSVKRPSTRPGGVYQ